MTAGRSALRGVPASCALVRDVAVRGRTPRYLATAFIGQPLVVRTPEEWQRWTADAVSAGRASRSSPSVRIVACAVGDGRATVAILHLKTARDVRAAPWETVMKDASSHPDESMLSNTALDWLALTDRDDSGSTWDNASTLFRRAVEKDDWRQKLKAARGPLGTLQSRSVRSVEPLDDPPGAPDGNYVKLEFDSRFERKKAAVEIVSLIEESDGRWRVAGYFIR